MIHVLLEGRDAPLYHCTSLPNAIKILESGVIKGSRFSISEKQLAEHALENPNDLDQKDIPAPWNKLFKL